MAIIEKFSGGQVTIPEDRRYLARQGLWAKVSSADIVCGLTEPALVLSGGVRSLEWLVEDRQAVEAGQAVVCLITAKVLFIDAPVAGIIVLNPVDKEKVSDIVQDPYDRGWLFAINPVGDPNEALVNSTDWCGYLESLRQTDGCRNPNGIAGGGSGICKAVYSEIRAQKL